MENIEVGKRLADVFRNVFNDNALEIKDELSAKDLDRWDSLTHFILITKIEKAFNIKFQLKELTKTRTVGDIRNLILSKL